MIHIPTLVNQFISAVGTDPDSATRHAHQLADLLGSHKCTLLEFIQYLGPSLTSENDLIRAKALDCLSSTLAHVNTSLLSKQDISVLSQFFLGKLDDKTCLQYVLEGIARLMSFSNFMATAHLEPVLLALLHQYDPKKNLAKVRYQAFNVLVTANQRFATHLQGSSGLCDLFVKTFIHLASGEKDPRNLLVSFDLNTSINTMFSFDTNSNELHATFVNDLFDVCFCYFPISFTPPPNDPYKISAEQLKVALRACIASQSLFCKDSFASLIEKLTSTNPLIRNDVLKTLAACIDNYSQDTIDQYWSVVWNAVKFEVLHNDASHFSSIIPPDYDTTLDDTDENKSLVLTLVIIQKLAEKLSHTQHDLFLQTVTSELKPYLEKAGEKSKQSVLILAAIASLDIGAFNRVVAFLFDYDIWGKYINPAPKTGEKDRVESHDHDHNDHNGGDHSHDHSHDHNGDCSHSHEVEIDDSDVLTTAKQRDLIDNFGLVFVAYQDLRALLASKSTSQYVDHFATANELTMYKDHLLIFIGQLLMTSSSLEKTLKCKAIHQLVALIQIPNFLNENEINLILGYFNDILADTINSGTNWEKDLVVGEIVGGSNQVAQSHQDLVIDTILSSLLIQLDKFHGASDIDQFSKTLTLIGKLCINSSILEVLSIRLSNKLDSSTSPQVFHLIVELFIDLINSVQSKNQFLMNSWYKTFVPRVLAAFSSLSSKDVSLVERIGDLVGIIVRFIDKSKHQDILQEFIGAFVEANSTLINIDKGVLESPHNFISIFNKILANVDKSVTLSADPIQEKVVTLVYQLESDEFLRIQYLQTLALLVNKFHGSSPLEEYYSKYIESKDLVAFEILIWLIKALILRTDTAGVEYVEKLVSLLNGSTDVTVKWFIARSLGILFIDLNIFDNNHTTPSVNTKKLISKVSNLNVKLLYKQQIFELILPRLIENCQGTNHPEISLNALSVVISNISKKILVVHLSEILPLVLKGVSVTNSSIIVGSSLSTLKIILDENHSILEPYVSSLIPSLLNLATKKIKVGSERINNDEIRALSLQNLIQIFSKFSGLQKYKASTLIGLKVALDDKKRNVRKLCCDLRQILYELN